GGSTPVTLRCEFEYPGDPKLLHKLMLALKLDDTWHQVDATLDLGGVHWVSQKTKYLGTTRNMSILFQPPSFDDTTVRKRIWVPLKNLGAAPREGEAPAEPNSPRDGSAGASPSHNPHAVLRIKISPSPTI